MNKFIAGLIIAIAATGFYFKDRWLPQPPGQANYLGYVEGETVMIAAPQAGRITTRPATKGAAIRKGDPVFSLDPGVAAAERARAEAAVRTAQAQLDNLLTGKREPELEQIRAQRREAEAGLALAKAELLRALSLTTSGTGSRTSLDQAQAFPHRYTRPALPSLTPQKLRAAWPRAMPKSKPPARRLQKPRQVPNRPAPSFQNFRPCRRLMRLLKTHSSKWANG